MSFRLNLPSSSDNAPIIGMLFNTTLANIIGSPISSVILPTIAAVSIVSGEVIIVSDTVSLLLVVSISHLCMFFEVIHEKKDRNP